jgi:hypothetical protein
MAAVSEGSNTTLNFIYQGHSRRFVLRLLHQLRLGKFYATYWITSSHFRFNALWASYAHFFSYGHIILYSPRVPPLILSSILHHIRNGRSQRPSCSEFLYTFLFFPKHTFRCPTARWPSKWQSSPSQAVAFHELNVSWSVSIAKPLVTLTPILATCPTHHELPNILQTYEVRLAGVSYNFAPYKSLYS